MTVVYTDSHCHLTDGAFADDLTQVLVEARASGVSRVVCIASDPDDARNALALADADPGIWSTAGVHPHGVSAIGPEALDRVRELAYAERCVAIGETGLDYYYDNAPRDTQRRFFLDHLELARETGLPVVVHCREAEEDMASIVREAGDGITGVLHCFGGPPRLLDVAMESGWLVSFTGTVTFKRFDTGVVKAVPSDRYMIETDAPYLAPVPHRGRRNHPGLVPVVAEAVAEIRGEPLSRVALDTWENAARFYRIGGEGAS